VSSPRAEWDPGHEFETKKLSLRYFSLKKNKLYHLHSADFSGLWLNCLGVAAM